MTIPIRIVSPNHFVGRRTMEDRRRYRRIGIRGLGLEEHTRYEIQITNYLAYGIQIFI